MVVITLVEELELQTHTMSLILPGLRSFSTHFTHDKGPLPLILLIALARDIHITYSADQESFG